MTQTILINEDNHIRWEKARKASDNTYVNSGSGTWSLKDSDDVELATGSLSYVASSNGRWHGTISQDDTADLTEGTTYFLEVSLTDGAGADAFRRVEVIAGYHGSDTP